MESPTLYYEEEISELEDTVKAKDAEIQIRDRRIQELESKVENLRTIGIDLLGEHNVNMVSWKSDVATRDAEILALKEQVASLQRVLAHRRDSDSAVVG